MRRILLTFLAAALLASAAAATQLEEAVVAGDCNGWTATVTIQWRSGEYAANLDYTVSLVDGDGGVLESFVWDGPVTREVSDPRFMMYHFGEEWTVYAPGGTYTVHYQWHLVGPTGDDTTITGDSVFVCDTVATEAVPWSTLKAKFD
ncbi:MAG: hypothetical protein R3D98_05290 [Candidatus Krumholzibacteriia bacterium]